MGMLEDYKAKVEAARLAATKGSKDGLSQPAPDTTPLPLQTIPTSVDKGISNGSDRLSDNDERTVKSDAVSGGMDNTPAAKNSDTTSSPGLQHEGNSKESAGDVALIDPEEAYCTACNKSVEDCDCIPSDDDEDSEESILAALGISKEKQDTFREAEKVSAAKVSEESKKDIEALVGENSANTENALLSAAEIVAREYAITEDDLIVFRNVFNQTHEKVKDLLPDQLEQKVLHLDKVIRAIQAMQQACKRLASDKISKETKKEKDERREREKGYKVPRRRSSDEVDATGAKKEIKGKSKRDTLIATLMKAGLSKEKAEAMADGN